MQLFNIEQRNLITQFRNMNEISVRDNALSDH